MFTLQLNVGPGNASKPEEQEDELTYASISFSKNWNKALYSNIRPAHLRRQTEEDEEEDDSLDYTTVSFTASNTTGLRYQNALEDSSTLYSTVMKKMVQGQNGWGVTYTSHICALKGSTVDIHCTYRYPSRVNDRNTAVEERYWFTKLQDDEPVDLRTDSEYAGRVQHHCDEKKYLQVTVNNPSHCKINPCVWAKLSCHSMCRLPDHYSYIWYINGQKIQQYTSSISGYFYDQDSFSCAVRGYEHHPAPSVYAPKVPFALKSPSDNIMEGSSVSLTCSSDANPAAKYTWYKKNQMLLNNEPQLIFNNIQSSDSGEYYCTAENELEKKTSEYIFIDVRYAPKLPSLSINPSDVIVEGSSVTLTCSSDANPAANYTWYKENQTLRYGPEYINNFTSISSEDSGSYHCKSENQYGQINSSSLVLDVQYAPKRPSVSVSPSGEIIEGSSVTLTCSSDANPASNYTWYKKNVNPDLQPLSKEPQFVFSSIQYSDSGEYYCTAENQLGKRTSKYIFIDVTYGPKLPSVSVSPSGEIVEGSSVTLTCSSDANPAAKYTWYKENQTLFHGPEGNYNFTSISSEDRGVYYCKSENQYGQITSLSLLIDVLWKSVSIMNIIKLTLVVLMLILLLLLILWIRKKKTLSSTTDLNEPVETIELDIYPVYENVSDLQVVTDRRHRGAGRPGLNQRLDSPDGNRK
ncbi:B-cell receptor CD22-like [Scomber scombrus]|uniref:B-cell receptor CD22-like n=1 Tax=Scomber scombrus TaxID=13677 RepID=UPI002DD8C2AD|nr:B-cell receptor CD22-like [Scomber scombrus]